jgi:hypothetical protein
MMAKVASLNASTRSVLTRLFLLDTETPFEKGARALRGPFVDRKRCAR